MYLYKSFFQFLVVVCFALFAGTELFAQTAEAPDSADQDNLRFEITPDMVEDVRIYHVQQMDNCQVGIILAAEYHDELYELTGQSVDQTLKIEFEGEILAAPTIRSPINTGRVSFFVDDEETAEAYTARLTGEE